MSDRTADMNDPVLPADAQASPSEQAAGLSLLDLVLPLARHWRALVLVPICAGMLVLGATYLITPSFTARATLLPPQQQGTANALLGSLGGLAGLAGGAALRTPGDQYVAMLMSQRVADKLIDKFDLQKIYGSEFRFLARDRLAGSTRITLGKKDGLIMIEVDDESPKRAADITNAYIDELRVMSSSLTVTEAQQRRAFFEQQLKSARDNLAKAQASLQASGISESTLRAEPRAAAEALSRIRAEIAMADVRLQVMRRSLADNTPEVQQVLAQLSALRTELSRTEQRQPHDDSNYIDKYREFKYQEGLVEAFSKQFELARLDESREGALIQVIDEATLPEWKTKPKRGPAAVLATLVTGFVLAAFFIGRHFLRYAAQDPETARKMASLRGAFRRRSA